MSTRISFVTTPCSDPRSTRAHPPPHTPLLWRSTLPPIWMVYLIPLPYRRIARMSRNTSTTTKPLILFPKSLATLRLDLDWRTFFQQTRTAIRQDVTSPFMQDICANGVTKHTIATRTGTKLARMLVAIAEWPMLAVVDVVTMNAPTKGAKSPKRKRKNSLPPMLTSSSDRFLRMMAKSLVIIHSKRCVPK